MSKFDFYTVAAAFGRADVEAFAAAIPHATVVDWLAYRDERTARGNALAETHQALPTFT